MRYHASTSKTQGHMKTCTKCKETKDLGDFATVSRSKSGKGPRCKKCHTAASNARAKAMPKTVNAYKAKWKTTVKGRASTLCEVARFNAKRCGVKYSLTNAWVRSDGDGQHAVRRDQVYDLLDRQEHRRLLGSPGGNAKRSFETDAERGEEAKKSDIVRRVLERTKEIKAADQTGARLDSWDWDSEAAKIRYKLDRWVDKWAHLKEARAQEKRKADREKKLLTKTVGATSGQEK